MLYVWASDQAHVAPDFLAVIDFDEDSWTYGSVITTVSLPPPGNIGNEPHHCHLSADKRILACGGLLSVLKGQNGIFFFDVTDARHPRFLLSTKALDSSITDDFFPLPEGGFLITQMGSASGEAPGRVAEFDGRLRFVANHFGTGFHAQGTSFGAASRRLQSARYCCPSRVESHADFGLRIAEQHARGILWAGASQYGAGLGLLLSQDHRYHPRYGARWFPGPWPDGRKAAAQRSEWHGIHRWHVRRISSICSIRRTERPLPHSISPP